MKYPNSEQLRGFLAKDFPELAEQDYFILSEAHFHQFQCELTHQELPVTEIDDHAAFMCLTFDNALAEVKPLGRRVADLELSTVTKEEFKAAIVKIALAFLVLLFLIALTAVTAHAQNTNGAIVVTTCGSAPANYPAAGSRAPATVDINGNTCTPTGAGGTSSNFGAGFPSAGTAIGARDTGGNMQSLTLDGAGAGANLQVNCKAGCSAAGDTVGNSQTVSALNQATSVALAGDNGAVVSFTAASSPLFTVVPEVSPDGSNWYAAVFIDPVSGAMSTSLVNPANGQYQLAWVGAEANARVRVSAYTSGAITMIIRATVTRPLGLLFGFDGTNIRPVGVSAANPGHLLVTPDANSAVNVAQVGGNAVATGNGTTSTGTQRVTISSDSTGQVTLAAGSATIGALTANQSVNVAQIAGTATTVNAGASGAGTQRVSANIATRGTEVAAGQTTMANSLPVAIASDQSTLNVIGTLGDNGAANTTNRVATLPGIAESNMPAAATAGRNVGLRTDLQGNLLVAPVNQTSVTTFSASKVGLVTVASPTDISVLSGNATNTVIVNRIMVSCTQTTAGIIDLRLLKRTTADSGGTSTGSPSAFPLDSNDAAAVSSVLTYTANPTVNDGTDRIIDSVKVGVMAPGTATPNDLYIWTAPVGAQALILRGTAQQAAINLNGVTLTGGSCDITYIWTETTGL